MPHVPQTEAPAPEITSVSITTGIAPVIAAPGPTSATFEITKAAVQKAQQAVAAVQQASVAATIAAAEANRLQRIEAALIAAGYTEAQIEAVATEGVQGIMDLAAALLGK
jgi:CO/xanthine dehydrogenase FAD-binding subunit